MSPEYGATCGFFPVDELTLAYLRLTGRHDERDRARRGVLQGEPALARPDAGAGPTRRSSSSTSATSSRRSPARAGRRTACRSRARRTPFAEALGTFGVEPERGRRARGDVPRQRPDDRAVAGRRAGPGARRRPPSPSRRRRSRGACSVSLDGEEFELGHGAVVIAAITSCTNTSNPQVMVAAGLRREEGGRARADAASRG